MLENASPGCYRMCRLGSPGNAWRCPRKFCAWKCCNLEAELTLSAVAGNLGEVLGKLLNRCVFQRTSIMRNSLLPRRRNEGWEHELGLFLETAVSEISRFCSMLDHITSHPGCHLGEIPIAGGSPPQPTRSNMRANKSFKPWVISSLKGYKRIAIKRLDGGKDNFKIIYVGWQPPRGESSKLGCKEAPAGAFFFLFVIRVIGRKDER